VPPPHERLDAEQRAVREPNQRLVLDEELAPLQRRRHRRGQAVPGDLGCVAVGVEQGPAALTVGLRPVQRDVGGLDDVGRAASGDLPLDDADARRHGKVVAADLHGRVEGAEHRVRHGDGLLGAGGALQQDHELVAAHARDQVAGAGDAPVEAVGDGHEQLVADVVAEAVVDDLEPVEVEVAEREPGVRRGVVEEGGEPLVEECPVRQVRQRVVQRLVPQAALQQVTLTDVLEHRHHVAPDAGFVADERHGEVGPDDLAVLAEVPLLHAEVVDLALHELPVDLPHVGSVVRMDEVRGGADHQLVHCVPEHVGQRLVDVENLAVEVGQADADRGVGEDGTEPRLAGPQRQLGVLLRDQHRLPDGLLLVQGAAAQRVGVPGGECTLEAREPRRAVALRVDLEVREEALPEQRDRAAQRLDTGEVALDQRDTDVEGRNGAELPCGDQRVGETAGELGEIGLDLAGVHRDVAGAEDRPCPGTSEALTACRRGGPGQAT
jgi:hypothetical protein